LGIHGCEPRILTGYGSAAAGEALKVLPVGSVHRRDPASIRRPRGGEIHCRIMSQTEGCSAIEQYHVNVIAVFVLLIPREG
jgi:hypothetical protein